ncbi:MAG: multidrug resistance efflux transporter family protein [Desulfovibrionaceae bacterium]
MARILLLGAAAALLFSSSFVLNRAMSLAGGHWFWSASLRYAWMLVLLLGWLAASGRRELLGRCLRLWKNHFWFWTVAGGVGFGVFYAPLAFSSGFAPGWVVAATWQSTILATPLVLRLFGRRVPWRAVALTSLVFAGVLLVNAEQAGQAMLAGRTPWRGLLLGALPVLLGALAYPLGNQMLWEATRGGRGPIPALDDPALGHSPCRVLLLTLGSLPFWLVLGVAVAPPPPGAGQAAQTLLVALFSGVAATSLFLQARHSAASAQELAAADATQSLEVAFSLLGEVLLLAGAWPGPLGFAGLGAIGLGLVLYLRMRPEV